MYKILLELLQAKFEGLTEKELGWKAKKLAKSVKSEEECKTAVEGVTFSQIVEGYGDSRATDASQSAVSNYEKKHKLKDGKSIEKEEEETKKNEPMKPTEETEEKGEMPAWAKALLESNKSLTQEIASIKQEKTAKTRLGTLNEVLTDLPEKLKNQYEKNFSRMQFKDDEDFNGWLEEIKPDIEEIKTDLQATGAKLTPPKGSQKQTKVDVNPYLKARIEEEKKAAEKESNPALIGL